MRVYVADLGANTVTLAWGRADGSSENTIGRGAKSYGEATVHIGNQTIRTKASWTQVTNLEPDKKYPYTVEVGGQKIGEGTVRTWQDKSQAFTFFVIGDFGNASRAQYAIARRMEEEYKKLESSGEPVRFVLSMGDNIYGKISSGGARDRDWEAKFFLPYEYILKSVPFKAVLGNHDGNESESRADLAVCLDNLFMPDRWYRFTYANFAEFIALDSTTNTESGPTSPAYTDGGKQSTWLKAALAAPPLPWRLAVLHHPMFSAGPGHSNALEKLRHWFDLFKNTHVQAVFSGHEHNLQFSERNANTGNMQFILSGSGGELRSGSVRKRMKAASIRSWANQNQFLIVRIREGEMTIQPVGTTTQSVLLRDENSRAVEQPVRVKNLQH
ncbi:hypothetical protein F183_A11160 [Bryobacterales bacterium F-183]|nr:hypothetical protein F183_A11160 [Bryobacterales bacterium F-183]